MKKVRKRQKRVWRHQYKRKKLIEKFKEYYGNSTIELYEES